MLTKAQFTKKSKRRVKIQKSVLVEATCTASFTFFADVVTSYSAGVSGYYKNILASDFTGLNTFQGLFLYYTPKRLQATYTTRVQADNGLMARLRVLDPVIDASFSSAITEPIQMASDPTTMQICSSKINISPILPFKNKKTRFSTASATSDKLAAFWLTFPVAQDPSGTATCVATIHMVVTFYRKAAQQSGT